MKKFLVVENDAMAWYLLFTKAMQRASRGEMSRSWVQMQSEAEPAGQVGGLHSYLRLFIISIYFTISKSRNIISKLKITFKS